MHFPVVLSPQQIYDFRVWFNPLAQTQYNDSLVFFSDAVNLPRVSIKLSGNGIIQFTNTGDILWQGHVPDNPFAYIQDYQPASMKIINDVNGDGVQDVVQSSKHYLVTCFNGNSSVNGDVIWTFNTGYNNNNTGSVMFEDALQIRSDVDGDGVQDVVFGCGGGNEFVYTISGRTGKVIWQYGDSIDYDRGDINGLRTNKDFNNDGIPDVLVSASGSGSGGRHAAICLNGINGTEIFNVPQAASFTFDITTLTAGGVLCVDINNGGPYKLNSFNNSGSGTWSVSVPEVIWSLKEIQDINNDGINDLAAYSGGINVNTFVISGNNGSVLWTNHYPLYSTFSTIRIISDLNSNGFNDMIFSGKEGVYRTNTKTGGILWSNTLDGSYVFGTDELGDLNSDGINEIAVGTKNSNLYILNGANGNILFQISLGVPVNEAVERTVRINSIDGNYSTELIIGTKDGRIICYSGGQAGPVPVELTSFAATVENKTIKLMWKTATELNNSGFRIERKENNLEWKNISFISGAGNSITPKEYSFTDKNVSGKNQYTYRLTQIDNNGMATYSNEIKINADLVPSVYSLEQNYPNPFNPTAFIRYSIPENSFVNIRIYNSIGEQVAELVNEMQAADFYTVSFDAAKLSSGIYFYTIKAGNNFTQTRKMVLLR